MLLEPVYRKVLAEPTRKTVTSVSADTKIIQLDRDFGDGFGLSLVGEIAADGSLSIEHYFPYVTSDQLTNQERIYIEKHGDKEAFAGISDSYELGMTLIFFRHVSGCRKNIIFKVMVKADQLFIAGIFRCNTITYADRRDPEHFRTCYI